MSDKTELTTKIESIFEFDEKKLFGWRRVDGDKTKYFMVQNPEAWYNGCHATTIEPADETNVRVKVYIIPGDTKITFKI